MLSRQCTHCEDEREGENMTKSGANAFDRRASSCLSSYAITSTESRGLFPPCGMVSLHSNKTGIGGLTSQPPFIGHKRRDLSRRTLYADGMTHPRIFTKCGQSYKVQCHLNASVLNKMQKEYAVEGCPCTKRVNGL